MGEYSGRWLGSQGLDTNPKGSSLIEIFFSTLRSVFFFSPCVASNRLGGALLQRPPALVLKIKLLITKKHNELGFGIIQAIANISPIEMGL